MKFRSSAKSFPHFQGTLQERINHPAKWCHKLPEGMSMELGALLEPLGVAIHAYRRSLMQPGQTALVFGAGAVGLLAAAVAKAKGAKTIVIADIDAGRVDFAVKNGFAHHGFVVPMKRGKDTEENLAIARETADGVAAVATVSGSAIGEVDVVFECTGVPTCVQSAIYVSPSWSYPSLPSSTILNTPPTVHQARRPCNADRHGRPHPNPRHFLRRPPRSRPRRSLPLRKHIPRRHFPRHFSLLSRPVQTRDTQVQGFGQCGKSLWYGGKNQRRQG